MKKIFVGFILLFLLLSNLIGCGNRKVKVTCSICNGTCMIKYYYGEGDNDYNMGPCTSCDEKGYIMVIPKGDSNHGKRVVCGGCETYVDELITKEDIAGEKRTWCAECWADYETLMGVKN